MKKITKKAAAPKPAAAPKAAPAPKAVAAPAAITKAPAKKTIAATRKKTVVTSPATFITAKIDIGFGNHLYIRGAGPGLSWDEGAAMDCVGAGLWTTNVANATAPVTFKVLVNDLSWSAGGEFVAEPGQSLTIEPSF